MEFLHTIFHFYASLSLFTVCHIYTNSDFKFLLCLIVCLFAMSMYTHMQTLVVLAASFPNISSALFFCLICWPFDRAFAYKTPLLSYIIYQYVWLTWKQCKAHYIIELMFVCSFFAWHKLKIDFTIFFLFLQICMAILRTYITIKESGLLKRAGMV